MDSCVIITNEQKAISSIVIINISDAAGESEFIILLRFSMLSILLRSRLP